MADKPSILLDLNIILDVLQKRDPFFSASSELLAALETGLVDGYIAAHSITTLYYLIRKGASISDPRATITNLLQILKIAPVNQSTIEHALNLNPRDFEDAVQMITAVQIKADYLITRNVKDYSPTLLPVMQPVEFLQTLTGSNPTKIMEDEKNYQFDGKTKMNVAVYKHSRLCFKADVIEPLGWQEKFCVVTPQGSFAMSKQEFYNAFQNVVQSKSYQQERIYHYPKLPEKALKFLVKDKE